jgi:hypothetical protein
VDTAQQAQPNHSHVPLVNLMNFKEEHQQVIVHLASQVTIVKVQIFLQQQDHAMKDIIAQQAQLINNKIKHKLVTMLQLDLISNSSVLEACIILL